ncbi:hypothetical protein [Virgisporangium ochraceum]|uniref:Uncharacterized protein n=1 Tax=Virgisporangium ochraceum TaxID=65505 RepID=A0A8J3ZTD4_9ACTN|nr:hypothetical protein [Virgisporangium ochraceum]GIJ70129.1 hypothetical protein Voc01_050460 [Virgisporangium ochraceum]
MSVTGVVQELLVRYLDVWTPTALHARRATFAYASTSSAPALPEAALRVFAEFADRMRGRRLGFVVVTPEGLTGLAAAPADLGVFPVGGPPVERLPVALKAAGSAKAPLLAFLDLPDGPSDDALAAVTAGKPAELMLVTTPGTWRDVRDHLRAAGFTLTSGVELVDTDTEPAGGEAAVLVAFASSQDRSLEAFKNAMWAVDEYAGVRYRDPGDPDGHLLDISLKPHPGPLRRELLAHLAGTGGRTVTELRRFTLTDTVYRSGDTNAAITSLLTAGAVTREPETGRLAGDVVVRAV